MTGEGEGGEICKEDLKGVTRLEKKQLYAL